MKINYQNCKEAMIIRLPEFTDTQRYKLFPQADLDSFFHGFSMYLIEDLLNQSEDPEKDPLVVRVFELINDIVEAEDEKLSKTGIKDIIGNLVAFDVGIKACRKLLREKGLRDMNVMIDPSRLTYYNVVRKTLDMFPEFQKTEHFEHNEDLELPYVIFFGFTSYILELLEIPSEPTAHQTIIKAFDLFNDMIESSEEKLSTLGVIGVLENLVQTKAGKQACQTRLRKEGLKGLIDVLKITGVRD